MKLNKKVTVLMPVYNGGKYLKEAIESILNQTYKDFDLLIINDGSTDNSEEVILEFSDERIKYIKNGKNMGLIETLNKGLDLISGEYIARMDQDDISLPKRLEKQVKFMDENRDIVVSGTYAKVFGEGIKEYIWKVPICSEEIKVSLLFTCSLLHPSVILRNNSFKIQNLKYNELHKNAEDYGLWLETSFNNKLGNIPEVLLKYRILASSMTRVSEENKIEREKIHKDIYIMASNNYLLNFSKDDLEIHSQLINKKFSFNKNINSYLNKLLKVKYLDKNIVENKIESILLNNILENKIAYKYIEKELRDTFKFRKYLYVKYLLKRIKKYLEDKK